MRHSRIVFPFRDGGAQRDYSSAVSLHGHTLHSKEYLDFIPRVCGRVPVLRNVLRRVEARHVAQYGKPIQYRRAWWTPPLTPRAAWDLETAQIENSLGLKAIVSLTDHDNIEAPAHLRVLRQDTEIPISVEWSVPFGDVVFHLGVHNLPGAEAQSAMREMAAYTAEPHPERLAELLAWFDGVPDMLVVFNHPFWDERDIGADGHAMWRTRFLEQCGRWVHALEWNGMRPRHENHLTAELCRATGIPIVSGGDRHGAEPNSVLNLTLATSFAGFAHEIRREGLSDLLLMPQWHEPFRLRVIHSICDILRENPDHGLGWRHWTDRLFYRCDDGLVRSFGELWEDGGPAIVRHFVTLVHLIDHHRLQPALRFALTERREPAL